MQHINNIYPNTSRIKKILAVLIRWKLHILINYIYYLIDVDLFCRFIIFYGHQKYLNAVFVKALIKCSPFTNF